MNANFRISGSELLFLLLVVVRNIWDIGSSGLKLQITRDKYGVQN